MADLATFPLRTISAAGVPVTVSTDDPMIFPETLTSRKPSKVSPLIWG